MFEWPMAGGECMFCEKDVFAITRKKEREKSNKPKDIKCKFI
jgi:hypothetical protein